MLEVLQLITAMALGIILAESVNKARGRIVGVAKRHKTKKQ